ncbi:MAG: hypothetical protein H7Z75_13090 [Ferruginibacter sp.]|nr:hypothetical protein [Cytophagales bacterium]
MGKKVIIHLTSPQFICPSCNRYHYEMISFCGRFRNSNETIC